MTTTYHQQILHTVAAIPYGHVSSYGDIAKQAGLANQARLVGHVLKTLPEGSRIPWHRVINGRGRISFPLGSCAYRDQCQALKAEGVIVSQGKVQWRNKRWSAQ